MNAKEALATLTELRRYYGKPRDGEALIVLSSVVEENAALKAEVEMWIETHRQKQERLEKAEAELAERNGV